MHPAGAQGLFGINADLATYGKSLAGGMPIGIVAGDARILDTVDGGTWRFGDDSSPQAKTTLNGGTFSKHPLAMVAARAVLTELQRRGPALQEELNAKSSRFVGALKTSPCGGRSTS